MTALYRFAMKCMRWIVFVLFRVKIENRECIPADRNFIVLSNHISAWDPITIAVGGRLYFRPMVKKELYSIPVLGFLLKKLGCIKVDRALGAGALAAARKVLARKETILVFPEGTRSRTGKLLDFKSGAFDLALRTGTPILPCQVIAPRGVRLFNMVKVRFGPLIRPEELRSENEDRRYKRAMAVVKKAFIRLRGDEMPG